MLKNVGKTLVCILVAVVLAASLVSCASTKAEVAAPEKAPAVLTKEDARMFWSISGTDKNGNPSKIYIQGTFHIADERCYPLATVVSEAFMNADRVFGELSTEGTAELTEMMPAIYEESQARANGRRLTENLSEEDVAFLVSLAGQETVDALDIYEPWVFTTVLDTSIYLINGFAADYGPDAVFNMQAMMLGKNVEGLDTVDCQIEALSFGTYEQQMNNFKKSLDAFKDLESTRQEALDFYQAYLDGDTDRIAEIGFGELEGEDLSAEELEFNEGYKQVLICDRNEKWAGIFEDLLEEGGTTFVYAGTLHFVGDYSVFSYMEENGTLVTE